MQEYFQKKSEGKTAEEVKKVMDELKAVMIGVAGEHPDPCYWFVTI